MNTSAPFEKVRVALYYYMLGARWFRAAEAMTYGASLHNGTRKDGVTPEFSHQVWIANHVRTLPLPAEDMDLALTAVFLHDTREDKDISLEEISDRFGTEAADLVDRLSKKFRGVEVDKKVYFERLAQKVLGAVVKGVDRLHNLSSMTGVFSRAKQVSYIKETREWHLPMLKAARRRFPAYEAVFENIKQSLESRITLIEAIHAASKE